MQPNMSGSNEPKTSLKRRVVGNLETDQTFLHAKSLTSRAVKSLPSATAKYLIEKIPIITWLPKYSSSWILNDLVAGTTIGLLLIPQSLAYAKIANIPEEYGLMSSWLPPLIYALMGTSKDLCPGPTSIIGVLVAEVIKDFHDEGYLPQQISGVLAFLVGVIALIFGLFQLGFLLDFISIPVLSGFISAAGLLSMLSQVPALFGNSSHGGTAQRIYDIFTQLPQARLYDSLIGFGCIAVLLLVEQAGKRWGPKYKAIWAISICRNAILIIILTIISFFVNRNAETPYFAICKTAATSISKPMLPSYTLLRRLSGRSIAIFLAASLEHLAIGTSIGRREGYKIDGSQELVFLGVSNLLNGLFPTLPCSGSFSRSAVNTECGVKTPLSSIITSAFVLLSLYFLTGALYWIPKATLAAVIIIAVGSLLIGPGTFYGYWRISLTDFIASMIAFWVTLFVSIDMGMALAVVFNIMHVVFRIAFPDSKVISSQNMSALHSDQLSTSPKLMALPEDTIIFTFEQPILFLNAERLKTEFSSSVNHFVSNVSRTSTSPEVEEIITTKPDRTLSNVSNAESKIPSSDSYTDASLSQLVVVLDFSHVFQIDTTGIEALAEIMRDMHTRENPKVQCRFVGLQPPIQSRLERAKWQLQFAGDEDWDTSSLIASTKEAPIPVFRDLPSAVWAGRRKEERTGSESTF
ncbi:hypothetical protein K3495_g12536 [Podosphaera aphanis]|nr:hypothetical protein K3495_g12536 [Podosphaera aphanis]